METMKTKLYRCCALPGLIALIAASPASADQQVYKWVDGNGRLNYSDTPPPENDKLSHSMLSVVQDRISTYATDPSLIEATAAFRRDALSGKALAIVQRDADRRALLAAQQRGSYDPCASNATDLSCAGGGYYPYGPYAIVGALRPPPGQFQHPGGFSRSFGGVRSGLSR
jgi:hypothetical protein